jgi:hypothetical protein
MITVTRQSYSHYGHRVKFPRTHIIRNVWRVLGPTGDSRTTCTICKQQTTYTSVVTSQVSIVGDAHSVRYRLIPDVGSVLFVRDWDARVYCSYQILCAPTAHVVVDNYNVCVHM